MSANSNITDLYERIRKELFYMIPEKWERIYLYASVVQRENNRETGEMFFYYFPKSLIKKNPVNVYQVPQRFNIDENEYIKIANRLYEMIKKLRKYCIKYEGNDWSNITIIVRDTNFIVEYNDDKLRNSKYTSDDRMAIWQYKYLEYPMEKFNKEQRTIIKEYLEEEQQGLHKTKEYSESFYQQHLHNSIQYDINKEEYINVDEMNNNPAQKKEPEKEIVIRNQLLKYSK